MADEKFSNFLTDIIDADLAEGKVDVVHTRFPPEPNGYLHIGSAKAIFINYTIAKHYGGLFNLRFDDTNPAREGDEYVQSILQDLKWLGAEPNGGIFYGSDYFERCYEYAEQLIKEGKAYVDDLTREEMQEYRGNDAGKPSRPSPYRDRTPEENLDLFRRMRAGEFADGEKTLRAKIDLASPNMNMRDPTIYRIKHVEHHRQGDKWCIYPMYDFAHPIQDAIEGITFSLCSLEFENHRPLYEWVITNLFGKEFPKQREFARLNVTNTVMSKRYLRELVEKNIVDGWDDPRMPTLSGLRRRGYTPTSIFTFVKEAGISKADNLVDMRQLEAVLRAELELNAAHRVDDGDDGGEVDAEPAVDFQVEDTFQRIDQRVLVLHADDGVELDVFVMFVGYDNIPREGDGVDFAGIKADLNEHHHVAAAVVVERAVIVDARDEVGLRAVRVKNQHEREQRGRDDQQDARRLVRGKKRFDF